MIVDTSAASAFVELVCLSLYGYLDTLLKTFGVRTPRDAVTESSAGYETPETKVYHIEACLATRNSVDLWELRELALSEGGLLKGTFARCILVTPSRDKIFDVWLPKDTKTSVP